MSRLRLALAWIAYRRALSAYREAAIHRQYAIEQTERGDELERQSRRLQLEAS